MPIVQLSAVRGARPRPAVVAAPVAAPPGDLADDQPVLLSPDQAALPDEGHEPERTDAERSAQLSELERSIQGNSLEFMYRHLEPIYNRAWFEAEMDRGFRQSVAELLVKYFGAKRNPLWVRFTEQQ